MSIVLPALGPLIYLDDDGLELLSGFGAVQEIPAGSILIRQEDPQTKLFILLAGEAEVFTVAGEKEVSLARLAAGDCFGEVSIFQPGVASATVRAQTALQLWTLDVDALQTFLAENPHYGCALMLGVNMMLSGRLKDANRVIKQNSIVPGFLSVRRRRPREAKPG